MLTEDAADGLALLRASRSLPDTTAWISSPEPKAALTAKALHGGPVEVDARLREQERTATWYDDFDARVRSALTEPDRPAAPGWETSTSCRSRVVAAAEDALGAHPGDDVVLVGHGTAWTLLVAALTGRPVDVGSWATMGMPDHCALNGAEVVARWGSWRSEARPR